MLNRHLEGCFSEWTSEEKAEDQNSRLQICRFQSIQIFFSGSMKNLSCFLLPKAELERILHHTKDMNAVLGNLGILIKTTYYSTTLSSEIKRVKQIAETVDGNLAIAFVWQFDSVLLKYLWRASNCSSDPKTTLRMP